MEHRAKHDFTIVTVDGTGTTTISGEVDILKFEINSINPRSNMSLGVNIRSLRTAIRNPEGSSICQVVTLCIRGMSYRLANNYLGCEPDLQNSWNGTYHLYFFSVNISRTMSNECKQREVAELNAAFHKYLAISNVERFNFMKVTGVSIERKISLWFTTYEYRSSPSSDGCLPEYFLEWFKTQKELHTFRGTIMYEWSKYHKNIVSCKLGDSAGEIANNTEIITVDTKSLTMTVEDRSKQQNVTTESCSRGITNKRNQIIPILIIGFLIFYHKHEILTLIHL
ncbi:unnamed protein product [Fasciola hepatica]|uniref:Uncharacterized protein n=1 Tax=Fasciola hepatica TaxID=6192 RepID=A0ABC9HJB2_FASHE